MNVTLVHREGNVLFIETGLYTYSYRIRFHFEKYLLEIIVSLEKVEQ